MASSTSVNPLGSVLPNAGGSFAVQENEMGPNVLGTSTMKKGFLQVTQVTLTAAQIIAMNGTPVTLLAAPGAGLCYVIESIEFRFTATATQFTGGGAVTFQYSGGAAVANTIAAAVITSASSSDTVRVGIDATATLNAALVVTNATAAFAAGTGTALITFAYRII